MAIAKFVADTAAEDVILSPATSALVGLPVLCRCILRLTERQPVAVTEFSGRCPVRSQWIGQAKRAWMKCG